jgi:hypothetical protein
MPFVKAAPNEFLLTGRGGRLENRGSAVQAFLAPGTVWVVVPAAKQEAAFEFTQETKDGIPLRFKGIIVYRITDPIAAARQFDFTGRAGVQRITSLLTDVVLGELRHAVSHMTMAECIEQRKTTLSGVAGTALRETVHGAEGEGDWGITIEVAQLAQVFIVDAGLRAQLEAEVRNEIKLRSDQSDIRTSEETRLAEMESQGRVAEQELASDRERLRREEALELAQVERRRRMQAEQLETERQALQLELEKFHAETAAEEDRVNTGTPIRRLRIARETEVLRDDLELRRLQSEVEALRVEHELMLPRAKQEMRRELLPLEQAPQIVESASKVLQGTNLSIYGEDGQLVGQLAPVLEIIGRAVRRATPEVAGPAREEAPAG